MKTRCVTNNYLYLFVFVMSCMFCFAFDPDVKLMAQQTQKLEIVTLKHMTTCTELYIFVFCWRDDAIEMMMMYQRINILQCFPVTNILY